MIDTRTFTTLLEHLNLKDPGRKYYLTYPAFSGLTVKSTNLQVGSLVFVIAAQADSPSRSAIFG